MSAEVDEARSCVYPIAPDLWGLDSHFLAMGSKGSLRMSVIKTPSGLILYSPVALREADIRALAELGRVKAIIAPNLYHHFHLRECMATYPDAEVFVPNGLAEKIGPIENAKVVSGETLLDEDGAIEHFAFSSHYLQETVLYHRASRTLVTADLIYHYTRDQFRAERLWFWLIGCYGRPKLAFYHRFAMLTNHAAQDLIDRVSGWQVERIVMSHGRIYEGKDAGRVFADAWRRLKRNPFAFMLKPRP